jgi:hypothetical protein
MSRCGLKALRFQIFLVALIVLSSAVIAADNFEAKAVPIIFRITPEEVAAYNVTVYNYASEEKIYSMSLTSGDATNWVLSPSLIKVPANSSASEVVNIFPKSTTNIGAYEIYVNLENGGETDVLALPVNMNFDGGYLDYAPNVELTVNAASEVQDPRESMKVSVNMRNRVMLDMKNITLRIRSDLFYKEINTSLGPRKEKTSEFLFDIDPLQAPGTYKLFVELYYPVTDKIVSESETEFKIDAYSSITPKSESSKKLFLRKVVISAENIGNYENVKEFTIRMPWYKKMFVSSDPHIDTVRIDGKSYLQWTPSVKPMETKTLTVTTNYRPLVVIILLIIAAIFAYFFFRSPVILLKEAGVLEQDEHGISEIKVKIFIKNRSRKSLENITVTDKVPGITEYVETNALGSMKPSRLTRTTAKGTILHWDLDKLDAFEERIVTYKLKSKLKVVGDMSLPKTRAKFTYGPGKREKFVISPTPLFFSKLR